MDCLETHGLCHRYAGGEPVLDSIDLRVPDGSLYGFLGPNGAGKTTTLRLVLGLQASQKGTIAVFGKRFDRHRIAILRNVGALIESPSLYDHLTAAENLAVLQKIHRCPTARIGEVLDLVGLGGTDAKKAGHFSLGMKQRLGIAMALLHRPSLLILDEPTNGLDPGGIVEMRKLLVRLNKDERITIVISSHLLAEVERIATHLGIIHRGRMVFQGTMEALRAKQHALRSVCFGVGDCDAALPIVAAFAPSAQVEDATIVVPAMPADAIARINRALVDGGIDVHAIHPGRDDLESIFMDLVGAAP